jgi:predicted aspartyl protease
MGALGALAIAGVASAEPPPAAGPSPIPLPELVKRYIAWRGGPPFARMKALHTTGAVEAAGLAGAFESWQSDDVGRDQTDLGGVKMIEVTTRRQSWTTNASGQVVDEPDGFKYASRDPQAAGVLQGKDKASAVVLGTEMADGRTWEVVRVRFGDADAYDDFIDPASGELGAMRVTEKGQSRFEHYSDWRMVGAVRIAFTTRVESQDLGVQTLRIKTAEIDPRLDSALFTRPEAQRRAAFAGGAASTGWIFFAASPDDRVYLPVTVDGRPMTAIFDTGATASAVDAGVLMLLHHAAAGAFPVPGENGVGAAGVVQGVDLGIGALSLRGLTVASLDLASIAAKSGEPWSAILGDEVFYETVVDLDFPGRRVAFYDPASFKPPAGAITVVLARDGDTRLVPLSLDGGPPALFIMDTGFSESLRIAPALARRQGLMAGQTGRPVVIGGIGGEAKGVIAEVGSVKLGGVSFAPVSAVFSDTWPSATYTDRVEGLLGLGLLNHFRVIVDWPHDRLYLIPAPAEVRTRF